MLNGILGSFKVVHLPTSGALQQSAQGRYTKVLPLEKTSNTVASELAKVAKPSPPVTLPVGDEGRIFLIDSMSFIFRAYHAMARQRSMTTKTGLPTAATYVFVNMLSKLREEFAPEYLAAVFDVGTRTFRDQQAEAIRFVRKFDSKTQSFQQVAYGGYKANRAAMPEDLAQQLPFIRRALQAYRIPILQSEGYEADDVIGTLAQKAAAQSYSVYIVSSDKDMLQLVNDKICVLNPPKDNLICDPAKVEEILGVPPERVVDVMALRGDTIDNIPGAPGIGDKGSVELIQRFGTVENALANATLVERKSYRESLLNNREAVLLSKQLATIDRHVPIELEVAAMRAGEADQEALRQLFTELEFTSLLKNLLPSVEIGETHYTEATQVADVEAVLKSLPAGRALAIAVEGAESETRREQAEQEDVELEEGEQSLELAMTPDENGRTAQNLAISSVAGAAITVSLDSEAAPRIRELIADPRLPKAIHDSKAARHALESLDLLLAGLIHDPKLYSYLLDPTYSSHALPDVTLRRFNRRLSGSLAESADMVGRLATTLRQEIEQAGLAKVYDQIDLPLVPVLVRMEQAGVKIDSVGLRQMSNRLQKEIAAKAEEIFAAAGGLEFNINSPKQLGDVLFNKLGLPKPTKYGKGRTISTAVDVLETLALTHEVPRLVLQYRQLAKLKSTYVDALPTLLNSGTGRVHTTFTQTGTTTGRLASSNPNLQNIPIRTELGRQIRAAFIAEPGHVLLAADYSQIELRLLAHDSQDRLLVEAFRRGDDIHTLTAAQIFAVPPLMVSPEQRRQAKVVNFGIVYGLSPFGLAENLGIDKSEAKRFIDAYFEKYTGVRQFIDQTLAEARRQQKVTTLLGRVRPIPDINSKNANLRGFAERTAVNTRLQGTAADLIKMAMIRIDARLRERRLKSRMTLQVHDELVFEVREEELDIVRSLVREQMENVYPLSVPLVVEIGIGKNWRDLD